ncbi:MAG: CDP-alcohol phosphatidyltransferase family protein [Bacteriovoracia bacterium]
MIDNGFRAILPRYVQPLLRLYQRLGLSPNAVTILGCFFGIVSAAIVAQEYFVIGAAIWWLGRLLDGTDGIYARHLNHSSKFGAFLDINCDMLAYCAMILAFAKVWPEHFLIWISIVILYVLCISGALSLGSLQGASLKSNNRKLHLAAGLAEGGETGIFYTICLLLPAYIHSLSLAWIGVLAVTVVARTVIAFQTLKQDTESK